MNKKKLFHIIYVLLFIVLNLSNCLLITSPSVVEKLIPYETNTYMIISSFIGNLSFLIIVLGLGYIIFKKEKKFYCYLFICTTILSVLLFVMSIAGNYYGMMFCFDNFGNINLETSGDSAFFIGDLIPNLLKISVPYFFISMVVLLICLIIYSKKYKVKDKNIKLPSQRNIRLGLLFLLIGVYSFVFMNLTFSAVTKDTWYEYNTTPLYNAQTKGILGHIADEVVGLITNEKELEKEDRIEALEKIQLYKQENVNEEYTGLLNGNNLLLIQMESINNFLVGLEIEVDGEFVEVMPNINQLVKENIYFDNYYTSVGMGNTADAEFSIVTGLYPPGGSYPIFKYNNNVYETLPSMFKELGYYTFSAHANYGKFYRRNTVHTQMYGFDKHFGSEDLNVTKENIVHRWLGDVDLLKQCIDIMNDANQPTFGMAITISNHTPYHMPLNGKSDKWFSCKENLLNDNYVLSKDSLENKTYRGYLEYAAYTDFAVGEAIKYLKETGLYDSTTIILYGDHGVDTDVFNMIYDYPEKFRNDINPLIKYNSEYSQLLEYQFLNNIPLIIADKKVEGKTISLTRSSVSLHTTISNLFGLNQTYYFNIDALSSKRSYAYNTKNEIIFTDGMILATTNKKCYVYDKSFENDVDYLINEYRNLRDINDKIMKYDLLK